MPTPKPTKTTRAKPTKRPLRAPQVLAYLHTHPTFFETYKEALLPLPVPAKAGNLLSLHAAKAQKTDKKAQALKTRYTQFVEAARQNATVTDSIHAAVLGALACTTPAAFRKYLQNQKEGGFMAILALDACHLATTVEPLEMKLLCPSPMVLTPADPALHRALFGANTVHMRSVCLMRLGAGTLLALGSTQATRFHAGQATTLASFMAKALAIHWENLNRA